MPNFIDYRDLAPLRDIAYPHSPFTENALRWHVFNAERNGLASALVRVGRRVYIQKSAFNAWLASQSAASKEAA
jgi:hypothetical protein